MNVKERQDIIESIKTILQNEIGGLRFIKLLAKLNENREKNKITKHKFTQTINYLKQEGWIRLQDYNLLWNSSKQVNYTPTITHVLEKYEITLKPKISTSVVTIILTNNLDTPLNSYHWFFQSSSRKKWNDFNSSFKFIFDKKEYNLPNKEKEIFFLMKNPYYFDFRIDFPIPLLKDQTATIIIKRDMWYSLEKSIASIRPTVPNQKMEFILNCPSPNYQLVVWQTNKETAQRTYANIQPSIKGNKITWESTSHNLEYYYEFVWQLI